MHHGLQLSNIRTVYRLLLLAFVFAVLPFMEHVQPIADVYRVIILRVMSLFEKILLRFWSCVADTLLQIPRSCLR